MQTPPDLRTEFLRTPIGLLWLTTEANGDLRAVGWREDEPPTAPEWSLAQPAPPSAAAHALRAYFDGDTGAIDGLPVSCSAGTAFQRRVWAALRSIPCGTVISYAELAAIVGNPAAVRAVGAANGANPIAVVVPCHRVVGKNGKLVGYAGGLGRKQWLLEHEQAMPAGGQHALPLRRTVSFVSR